MSAERDTCSMQRTLRHSIGCVGVGMHTGARVAMTLHPADADSGIRFRRTDRRDSPLLAAHFANVADTDVCTTIADAGSRVASVEHIMAALAVCGIDNALVELSGPEVPAMDGSAQPFVFLIECAGTAVQEVVRPVISVCKTVEVTDGPALCRLVPADSCSFHCRIEHTSPSIGIQEISLPFHPDEVRRELVPARRLFHLGELRSWRDRGLARGVSRDNSVVVTDDLAQLDQGVLRFPDEAVRHAALDAVGDMALAGCVVRARFVGVRPSHRLTAGLLQKLFENPDSFTVEAGRPLVLPRSRPGGDASAVALGY